MKAAYLALVAGLPIPVSRSWPQHEAPLPSCAFHLESWDKFEDGSSRLALLLSIRVNSPSHGDGYTAQADTALSPLGYVLEHAEDTREADTGFFLRLLTFALYQNVPVPPVPPVPPEEQYPLYLRIRDVANAVWLYLPGTIKASFKPETREYASTDTLSYSVNNLPALAAGKRVPGSITITTDFLEDSPALAFIKTTFFTGAELYLSIRYRSSRNYRVLGPITALHVSPLGVEFTITHRGDITLI